MSQLSVPAEDIARVRAASEPGAAAPRVAIVAGSGLAGLTDALSGHITRVPYSDLAGYPRVAAVAGHAGGLVLGELSGVTVALFAGRTHLYQGVSALEAAYPARLAAALGCEVLVLTNAAGAVAQDLVPGDLVLIRDHINLTGANPLVGWAGPDGGTPFVQMRDAWDAELRATALDAARETGIELREGVYAAVLGPSYETPAEVAALRALGADVVGMSTVPEAIAARALGLRLLGVSLVANAAAGEGLAHGDVVAAGERASATLASLLAAILSRLAAGAR